MTMNVAAAKARCALSDSNPHRRPWYAKVCIHWVMTLEVEPTMSES